MTSRLEPWPVGFPGSSGSCIIENFECMLSGLFVVVKIAGILADFILYRCKQRFTSGCPWTQLATLTGLLLKTSNLTEVALIKKLIGTIWCSTYSYGCTLIQTTDIADIHGNKIKYRTFLSALVKVIADGDMQGVFWATHCGHQCQLHVTQNGGNWWSSAGQLSPRDDLPSLK